MANLIDSLIAHLKADATVSGLCAQRIGREIDPEQDGTGNVTPAIAISPTPTGDFIGQAAQNNLITFIGAAKTASDCETLSARLAVLFQDRWHYYLAGNALLVIKSLHQPGPGVTRDAPDSFWQFSETYQFITPF